MSHPKRHAFRVTAFCGSRRGSRSTGRTSRTIVLQAGDFRSTDCAVARLVVPLLRASND
jgi:hypothetical protein